jgi:Zn-dependent protease
MSIAIFTIAVFVFSAVIHEYMHGWAANEQGDQTAKMLGRLTLNPLAHLDLWGSFLMPALLYFGTSGAFVFGYAKPVPYNPFALRDRKYGAAKVAAAGPLANLAMALAFGAILRFMPLGSEALIGAFAAIIHVNLILAVLNLIPLPGLDGSKVLMPFLPLSWQQLYLRLEAQSMLLVFFVIMLLFPYLAFVVNWLFRLIVGV